MSPDEEQPTPAAAETANDASTEEVSAAEAEYAPGNAQILPDSGEGGHREALAKRLLVLGLKLVRDRLGEGGSAWVHQAVVEAPSDRLPRIGTEVAVKEFKPELLAQPGQLRRVKQEADIGSRVDSEFVVKTFGLLPSEDDPEFLVMEWIEGSTLEDWNAGLRGPEWGTLQRASLDVVDGLEALHSNGILHRDLKPENVMVRSSTGRCVIMDVGVAELTVESAESLHTNVKDFLGSVRYASPQYIRGEPFQPSDDVYGLGTILHELLTGKKVFDEHARKVTLPFVILGEGQRPEALRQNVPAPLEALRRAALHREPSRRPVLSDARASLADPAGADFITREMDLYAAEERGYQVIRTEYDGSAFFADLASSQLEPGNHVTVVRRSAGQVLVPSLSRDAELEEWVGTAVLKHIHSNVGYFILIGTRWEPAAGGALSIEVLGRGRNVKYEKVTPKVKVGDRVLSRRY